MTQDINYPEEAHQKHWICMLKNRVCDCERKAALYMQEAEVIRQWIAELERELVSVLEDCKNGRR
jgi:hypothetical protein